MLVLVESSVDVVGGTVVVRSVQQSLPTQASFSSKLLEKHFSSQEKRSQKLMVVVVSNGVVVVIKVVDVGQSSEYVSQATRLK